MAAPSKNPKNPPGSDPILGRTTPNISTQIGDLMVAAGLTNGENLDRALELSKAKKQPLGRVVVESGLLTEKELYATLQGAKPDPWKSSFRASKPSRF